MIQSININEYIQDFSVSINNKIQYGEVHTPFSVIEDMLDMVPPDIFEDKDIHWIDPACGCGYFPMVYR